MVERTFERANDESRERLARLVAGLTPALLEIDLGEGWTVASALGHIGFWDRWQTERWERMLAGEWPWDSASVKVAEDIANDALHPYWEGQTADHGRLALEAAARLDAIIAGVPDSFVEQLEGTPYAYLLHRHRHRDEHLDHIERSIAAAAAGADGSFVERNAASRRHLASLVERLRPEDLALSTEPTEEGSWTVAQVLGHLLFWDRSMEARWRLALERAGETGVVDVVGIPGELTEAINRPLAWLIGDWSERLGPAIGSQAVAAAEAVDSLAEAMVGRLPAGALATRPNVVHRWSHREAHLGQVEKALAGARPSATPPDRSFVERNRASQAELAGMLAGMSAADLARPAGDGTWNVGQVLGHLGFWDRFLAARWRAALAAGPASQPSVLPHELADLLNDGLPSTWAAFAAAAGESVIAETLAAAKEVDAIIGGLPAETPVEAILSDRPALLDRSIHRREHLAQIEAALAGRGH
jgi:uncharacterized damage-inducible protein DinB